MSSVHLTASAIPAGSSTASRPASLLAAGHLDRQHDEARVLTRMIERLAGHSSQAPPAPQVLGARIVILDAPSAVTAALSPPGAQLAWSDPAVLGPFIGKGHFHRAFAIDHARSGGARQHGPWMGLIANDAPSHQDPTLRRYYHALNEHRHAARLTAVTPELLPGYAGLAAVLPMDHQRRDHALRFATLWQRKDATFEEIVSSGGLAGRATIQDREFTALDVSRSMLLIGRAYQQLHDHDMVYTDPKPANLAFSLTPSKEQRGSRTAAHAGHAAGAAAGGAASTTESMVADVVFIDAESMQPPGYARDPARAAVSIMTPSMLSEEVLRGVLLGGGMALKRAQATMKNDIFHSAVISYGLVTGEVPQLALGRQRYQQRCEELKRRGGFSPKEAEQVLIDEFRLTRVLDGYEHEQQLLTRQVRAHRIPQALAQVVSDGLQGRIATFGEWERRTLAIQGAPE